MIGSHTILDAGLIDAVYQGEAAKLKELELSGLVDFTTDSAE